MHVYFLIATMALSAVFFPTRLYIGFCLLLLTFICGARDGVLGYDFSVYESYFSNLLTDGNVHAYEAGYFWINYIFAANDLPFHAFLFCLSFFYHLSLFFVLFYLEDEIGVNPGWILFFYVTSGFYFWHAYTLLRQSVGISLFYLSMGLNLKGMFFLNLISPLFHVSSVINIFVVGYLKIREKISVTIGLVIFITMAFFGFMLTEYFSRKFEFYGVIDKAGLLVLIETLLQSFILIAMLGKNRYSSLIKIVVCVSVLFCFLGFFINEIFIRFLEPYKLLMLMSYALLLCRLRVENIFLYAALAVLFVALSYLRMYRFFTNFGEYAIPYNFIF